MNYDHAYHAGNFADVLKHAVLCRVLTHLREKETAFRVIDTHAGAGLYDLSSDRAARTQEWRSGIGRLLDTPLAPEVSELLAPYLDAVRQLNGAGELKRYPGSPALVQTLLRAQDRLIACELEPRAAEALAQTLKSDRNSKAIAIDGWTALTAYVPPKERRGLVLVDPPFEQPGEYDRVANGLIAAHAKWPTGIYLLWYPIKDVADVTSLIRALVRSRIPKLLRAELTLPAGGADEGLRGSGLIVANPPWRLHDELTLLLPSLAAALSRGGPPATTLQWLGAPP